MKKIFAVILVLVVCVPFVLSACSPGASDEPYIYTASGDGKTCSFVMNKNIRETKGSFEVPEEVTVNGTVLTVNVIGESAFDGCSVITEIVLPDSVEEISFFAFKNCPELKEINIPASLKRIKLEAFRGCSIETVVLPEGLKEIGGYVFADCKKLKSIVIPSTVTTIGIGILSGCDAIENVVFLGSEEQWNSIVKGEDNPGLDKIVFAPDGK